MSSVTPKRPASPAPSSDSASAAHNTGAKAAGQKPPAGKDKFEAAQASDAQFQQSVQSEILPDNKGEKSAQAHGKAHHGKKPEDGIDPTDPSMQPVLTSKP